MPVDDPIIDAYRDAFPKLFKDFEDMPDDLEDHLRYPEDLFRVQTNMWGDYHIGDPAEFYAGDDRWDVARDPGTAGAAAATQTTDASGNAVSSRSARIDPYYLLTKLPGSDAPEFILLRPFVPTAARDDNQRLTAFMVGKSDGENYGKLQVFVMPGSPVANGPALVQGEIQSDPAVSREESLLGGGGSSVDYGSLTAIPIDNGLVYVRPFYVTSNETEVPALQKVIVYFGGEVAIRDTLQEGLTAIFGSAPPTLEEGGGETPAEGEPPPATGTVPEQVSRLLVEANDLFAQADDALAARDLARYEQLVKQGRAKTAEAEKLLEDAGIGTTTTTAAGAQA
jgi:uncharacterized membrane protein (UPF0182 family)